MHWIANIYSSAWHIRLYAPCNWAKCLSFVSKSQYEAAQKILKNKGREALHPWCLLSSVLSENPDILPSPSHVSFCTDRKLLWRTSLSWTMKCICKFMDPAKFVLLLILDPFLMSTTSKIETWREIFVSEESSVINNVFHTKNAYQFSWISKPAKMDE